MQIVEVKAGDTLYALARRYATTVEALAFDNQIADPARLTPGQTLVVPGGSAEKRRCAEVNAYAYPNIAPRGAAGGAAVSDGAVSLLLAL